jgi:signal transduction histidine kinase
LLVLAAGLGIGRFFGPATLVAMRRLTNLTRRLVGEWCGVPIAELYRPSAGPGDEKLSFIDRLKVLLTDVTTWRDLLWVTVNMLLGWILAAVSAVLIVVGLVVFIAPVLIHAIPPPAVPGNARPTLLVLGAVMTAVGVSAAPWLLRGYGLLAGSLLAPAGKAALALRVHQLSQTRTEALDTGAAEIRRIERDLHDGAQARLVALGMNIGLAEQVVKDDPELALTLLAEARAASGEALTELRALVRGIHPPVLAERGLDGAVCALALSLPLHVDVHINVPGRGSAPVESAAYFVIAEALTNVVKHSGATRAWVQLEYEPGKLVAIVGDNGTGGAAPRADGGLRGIERRLSAFDGMVAVTSPIGGPTQVTMELPCELSLART